MSPGALLLFSAAAILLGLVSAWRSPRLWLIATIASAAAALGAALSILAAGGDAEWRLPLSIGGGLLHLRLDALSAFFLALLALLGGAATLYAREYWTDEAHPRSAPT
ncbi:MAG: NADH-quinone oxidoreductase subunit H, partial [Candidatus Eisenbacteria bacterium]